MTDQNDRNEARTTGNASAPDPRKGGGPVTPGRAGQGMGVSAGDAPAATGGGPETTVTVGEGTGQRRDLPDQHAAPPTPKEDAGKRPRKREDLDDGHTTEAKQSDS